VQEVRPAMEVVHRAMEVEVEVSRDKVMEVVMEASRGINKVNREVVMEAGVSRDKAMEEAKDKVMEQAEVKEVMEPVEVKDRDMEPAVEINKVKDIKVVKDINKVDKIINRAMARPHRTDLNHHPTPLQPHHPTPHLPQQVVEGNGLEVLVILITKDTNHNNKLLTLLRVHINLAPLSPLTPLPVHLLVMVQPLQAIHPEEQHQPRNLHMALMLAVVLNLLIPLELVTKPALSLHTPANLIINHTTSRTINHITKHHTQVRLLLLLARHLTNKVQGKDTKIVMPMQAHMDGKDKDQAKQAKQAKQANQANQANQAKRLHLPHIIKAIKLEAERTVVNVSWER